MATSSRMPHSQPARLPDSSPAGRGSATARRDDQRVDVLVTPEQPAADLRKEAEAGLTSMPKELPPKWLYDERGSALFDAITRQPEYYLTQRETEILRKRAGDIAMLTQADTVIELGSGRSPKTRILLDAFDGAGLLRRFVPFDVSEPASRASAAAVDERYPAIEVHAVVGDIERHLAYLPTGGRRLVALLGSTMGNFLPERRAAFLAELGARLEPGDAFLVGTDLVKDVGRLERAYDDAAGITAAFNHNILWVLNRELQAEFAPERFYHVARWDPRAEWIEMLLRADGEQRVHVGALAIDVEFANGEEIRTEVSAKFRRDRVEAELAAAGLELVRWWTDPAGDFALSLAFPAS
jgi:L-histidine Nalpha-methyltransferase